MVFFFFCESFFSEVERCGSESRIHQPCIQVSRGSATLRFAGAQVKENKAAAWPQPCQQQFLKIRKGFKENWSRFEVGEWLATNFELLPN